MNQPPPHGWHRQPPQGPYPPQQQGWQGHPPQPGWGPPPPPEKSKAPVIITLSVVALLVLGGGITAAVLYFGAHEDGGSSKRSDQLPAACSNVSEAALKKARTTNPNKRSSSETDLGRGKRTICSWNQTKGVDGEGLRNTDVYVTQDAEEEDNAYQQAVQMAMANTQGTPQQKPLEGLGDEATAVLMDGTSAFTDISIIVRKGDHVVEVDHTGWDVGVFSPKRADTAEFEAAARGIAEAMVSKL
ncbi:hypothetical protein BBK82_18180 [Lentzea guizhouensis]|uniref:DUF3558 domain-containing protein n=1 Tax=Lentzea guizhouensis TaxID=1586287 RepID=A0A1B2HIZ7_9PSEU|nr:hypothetical protein [Lentzea guizhouensis]ANZ37696.1 hypothetical protein BBK82_18180 [Lentzea guizhouensis]